MSYLYTLVASLNQSHASLFFGDPISQLTYERLATLPINGRPHPVSWYLNGQHSPCRFTTYSIDGGPFTSLLQATQPFISTDGTLLFLLPLESRANLLHMPLEWVNLLSILYLHKYSPLQFNSKANQMTKCGKKINLVASFRNGTSNLLSWRSL